MASKYEKLIEYVIANDQKKARNLFHQIVVGASRKIYEDLDVNPSESFDDVDADHTGLETHDDEDLDTIGGDESDDLETDVFVDDEDEMGGDGMDMDGDGDLNPDVDDRVSDLENTVSDMDSEFEALKAEFEKLINDEDGEHEEEAEDNEEEADDMEEIEGDIESDDFDEDEEEIAGDEADEELADEDEEAKPVDEAMIREYVEKVTKGLANSSEESFVQKKSPVAGKNEIVKGVGPKNIAAGGTEKGRTAPPTKELIGDKEVVNRPGHKAALKPAPKADRNKEAAGTNTKSVETGKGR